MGSITLGEMARYANLNKRKKVKMTKICPVCNTEFYKPPNNSQFYWETRRVYCSNSCSTRSRAPNYNDPTARCQFFLTHTITTSLGCLEWQGTCDKNGYGYAKISGVRWYIHRAIYHYLIAPIPNALCVLHKCDNPPCINSDHLFLGTHRENMQDMVIKGRTNSPLSKFQALAILFDPRLRRKIAKEYGISHQSVSRIKSGERWNYLQEMVQATVEE